MTKTLPELDEESLVLVESSAEFSTCRRYRYVLRRRFGAGGAVMFVGLNPSTADESRNDPTVNRCIGFAKRWGYGTLIVGNLYAWRATNPHDLKAVREPRGEKRPRHPDRNLVILRRLAREVDLIVAAWGAWPGPMSLRAERVLGELSSNGERAVMTLGLTRSGAPRHPLYVRSDAELIPYPCDG